MVFKDGCYRRVTIFVSVCRPPGLIVRTSWNLALFIKVHTWINHKGGSVTDYQRFGHIRVHCKQPPQDVCGATATVTAWKRKNGENTYKRCNCEMQIRTPANGLAAPGVNFAQEVVSSGRRLAKLATPRRQDASAPQSSGHWQRPDSGTRNDSATEAENSRFPVMM
jgi:hypothetical protein